MTLKRDKLVLRPKIFSTSSGSRTKKSGNLCCRGLLLLMSKLCINCFITYTFVIDIMGSNA